uniref:Calnexin n=1 Tax=Arundo donax TaxID=35708 RepID=A0A0A9EFW8_ARUDO
MKCTLFVDPHLSGPNIIVYGVSLSNSLASHPAS